jgi:tetratricopeptide (TPR) repeat protein
MQPLDPRDQQHLGRAQEWLAREEFSEARFAFDQMSEAGRSHPESLAAAVAIFSGLQNHGKTIEAGRALVSGGRHLDRAPIWLALADALHQVGQTQEAYDTLKQFAAYECRDGLVFYRLAVYACLLGKSEEAKAHFTRAMNTAEGERLKREAWDDEQLRDIWEFLCKP